MIPQVKPSSIVCSNYRTMAMLALRQEGTEEFFCLFFKFIAERFLRTHRLCCILSYILLLDIEVTVNWHMLSPFLFPPFFGFEERKGMVWSLVSKSFFVFTSPTSRQLHRFDQLKKLIVFLSEFLCWWKWRWM